MTRPRLTIIIFITGCVLSGCLPGRIVIESQPLKKFISTNGVLSSGHFGLALFDPAKEKFIATYHSGEFFTPASVTKLFTFYSAVKMLKDSIPSIKYCISADTLYFSGMGDPTFLDARFTAQPAFLFLKNAVYALAYCPAVSSEQRFGPGWAWDDFIYDYSPEKSPFPVYRNMINVNFNQSASVPEIFPEVFEDSFNIILDPVRGKPAGVLTREEARNRFLLVYDPQDTGILRIPFITGNQLTVEFLEDTLRKEIFVSEFPETCPVRFLKSQSLDSVMRVMLNVSDNFIAEQTLMGISGLLSDTLSTDWAIRESIRQFLPGLEEGISWVDGSGLSRYNQFSPGTVIEVLKKIMEEIPFARIISLLPNNGISGKILTPIRDEIPFIYGKSGSMTHVYNISGYIITRKGKILLFCIMNNNFNGSEKDAEYQSGRILISIRDNF